MDTIWNDDPFKPFLRCTIFFQNRLLFINTGLSANMVFLVHPCILNSKFMLCPWVNVDYFDTPFYKVSFCYLLQLLLNQRLSWLVCRLLFWITCSSKLLLTRLETFFSWNLVACNHQIFCSGITEEKRWVRSHRIQEKTFPF